MPALLSRLPPRHAGLFGELFRFGVVGTLGFLIDTVTLYAALSLGAGLYLGRALSYLTAASANWALNRAWTFRDADRSSRGRQWAMFLLVNLFGFVINYGTYSLLVSTWALAHTHPVIGVAAGSIAGLGGNFLLSRRFVFRSGRAAPGPARDDTTPI
ncbi:GtrA family protein [Roseomonas marmotae]|uniref:GtrA family protein n=1 Tax=Roseomonas marmotae TaxID=2768161 RepID=A0ABS3KAJ6_9PROT|nr:GtrA family protein [Roseomonas marmotae]QTI80936.1 GtrA family protein [Roseomonas marmotae]